MSTATSRSRDAALGRLSPLILLAVAMPWILEEGIIRAVSTLPPAYESVVTEGIGDAVLYPVVTGSIVLIGLYALLDAETRQSLFRFRRPSRRELLVVVAAVPAGIILQSAVIGLVASLTGVEGGSTLGAEASLSFLVTFVIVGAVFAPLVEEVLFRGLLLGYLLERDIPTLVAASIVAVGFGAIHYYGGPTNVAATAAWATIPIALRLRYDNLTSPVLLHALTNLSMVVLLLSMA